MRIETETPKLIVEIDDKEYEIAPRTEEVAEKLLDAETALMGKPAWRLWRAQLEILLGKPAMRELFPNGKKENLDRMQLIYAGVSRAFLHTDEAVTAGEREKAAQSIADALAPVNELLRRLSQLENGSRPAIPKP